ncbi:MAG: B12-binding domain-containing radical SAM protein, partial [Bacillota bacterium]|nr:B12-binding domain-containing radical SAM protein [Bacillota bacterium]
DSIKEFAELGLKAVLVGYESFDDREMKDYKKKSVTKDNSKAAKILKSFKVDVWASFIANPDWNKKDFKSIREYIKLLEPEISSINPLTPFPNLTMYEKYKDRLLYEKEDYEKWSFGQVTILPSKMSLRRYYFELLKTNLYVNLFINKKTEMIKHYGIKNIFRIFFGSIKAMKKYIILMIKS